MTRQRSLSYSSSISSLKSPLQSSLKSSRIDLYPRLRRPNNSQSLPSLNLQQSRSKCKLKTCNQILSIGPTLTYLASISAKCKKKRLRRSSNASVSPLIAKHHCLRSQMFPNKLCMSHLKFNQYQCQFQRLCPSQCQRSLKSICSLRLNL